MMPLGSIKTPEPSDWDLRARESPPKKNSSKRDGRRRTICSAAMFTTEGETFSTTSTTSLRRAGSGAPRAGRASENAARTAAVLFTGNPNEQRIPLIPRQEPGGRKGRPYIFLGCRGGGYPRPRQRKTPRRGGASRRNGDEKVPSLTPSGRRATWRPARPGTCTSP